MEKIKINDIRMDEDIQARAKIDESVIKEYAEAMEENVSFPPVTVYHDGNELWLSDGFHRIAAEKRLGYEETNAEIRKGGRRDAIIYSVGANSTHGLRRTNEDKHRAAGILLDDPGWKKKTDGWISEQCAVSQPFVSKLRRELTQNGSESTAREGRDGRAIDTGNIGKIPSRSDEPVSADPDADVSDPPSSPPDPDKPGSKKPQKTSGEKGRKKSTASKDQSDPASLPESILIPLGALEQVVDEAIKAGSSFVAWDMLTERLDTLRESVSLNQEQEKNDD
jgi:hypothetical protein